MVWNIRIPKYEEHMKRVAYYIKMGKLKELVKLHVSYLVDRKYKNNKEVRNFFEEEFKKHMNQFAMEIKPKFNIGDKVFYLKHNKEHVSLAHAHLLLYVR